MDHPGPNAARSALLVTDGDVNTLFVHKMASLGTLQLVCLQQRAAALMFFVVCEAACGCAVAVWAAAVSHVSAHSS